MVLKTFKLVVFSSLVLLLGLPPHLQKRVNKEIKETYGVEVFDFVEKPFSMEEITKLPSEFNASNFFEIKQNDSLLGYAYVSKAPSKTDQFDYLVLFSPDLTIKKTKVLIYREDYGGEIGSKRWLKQFVGKTYENSFDVGQSIDAISGATISVNSMTKAMDNLMKSLQKLRSKQLL